MSAQPRDARTLASKITGDAGTRAKPQSPFTCPSPPSAHARLARFSPQLSDNDDDDRPLSPSPPTASHDPGAHCPHPGLLRSWLASPVPATAGPCLHPLKPGLLWPMGCSSRSPRGLLVGGTWCTRSGKRHIGLQNRTQNHTSQQFHFWAFIRRS